MEYSIVDDFTVNMLFLSLMYNIHSTSYTLILSRKLRHNML